MIEPLAVYCSRDQFTDYVENTLSKKMGVWRPRGVVLHNTDAPTLKQFYVDSAHGNKPMSGATRVKNMWVSYKNQGWNGGPHLVVTDREIILANPLWLRGTHSPSWNSTFWGLEMAGSYSKEVFPDTVRDNAVHACAVLYAMLGHEPDNATFHFHKEDPRTTHKTCPGVHVGQKSDWIKMIGDRMSQLHPGGCEQCKEHTS